MTHHIKVGFLFYKVFIIMKIIITEDQLSLINEDYNRDRFDAEYSDEDVNIKDND